MKEWKQHPNTQKVYEDLYKSSDADNEDADTYLTLIIKTVFMSEKERTASNGVWVQSVLETIFDINQLPQKSIQTLWIRGLARLLTRKW